MSSIFVSKKSTNVRSIVGLFDSMSDWFRPSAHTDHRIGDGMRMYLHPERSVTPPALPEPAGGMVLAVPGYEPHLAARIWGAERGPAAPLVLFVHDWEGQMYDFLPFIGPLLAVGARVVAFDAPGHGRSTGDTAHLPGLAAAVKAVVAAAGGQVAMAVGHGFGAAGLVLARQEGVAVGRMVLLAPLVDLTLPVRQIAHVLRLDAEADHRLLREIDRAVGRPLASLSLHGHPGLPALLIHSVDDRIMPVADALQLAAGWPGLTTHLVEGLGHRRLLADPAVVARVTGFLLPRA